MRSYVDKDSFQEVARDVKAGDVPRQFEGYKAGEQTISPTAKDDSTKFSRYKYLIHLVSSHDGTN